MTWAVIGIGGASLIGGGVLSATGASSAQSAANKARDKALRLFMDNTNRGQGMLAGEFLGKDAMPWLRANLGDESYRRLFGLSGDDINSYNARKQLLNQQISQLQADPANRSRVRAMKQELTDIDKIMAEQGSTLTGQRFADQYGGSRGAFGQLQDISNQAIADSGNILSGYNADTAKLAGMDQGVLGDYDKATRNLYGMGERNLGAAQSQTAGLINDAKQMGKGRADQIERDYARGLEAANASDLADLVSSGVSGSSILTNAKQGNRRRMGDVKNDALLNLNDQQLAALRAAKQYGFGTENSVRQFNQGNSMSREGGRTALQDSMTGRAYSRSAGRTGLEAQLSDRNAQYASIPVNTRMALFSSPAFNPFLQQGAGSMQAFVPQGSSGAAFGQTIGNAMAGLGSAALFSGFGRNSGTPQSDPSLEQMRRWSQQYGGMPTG